MSSRASESASESRDPPREQSALLFFWGCAESERPERTGGWSLPSKSLASCRKKRHVSYPVGTLRLARRHSLAQGDRSRGIVEVLGTGKPSRGIGDDLMGKVVRFQHPGCKGGASAVVPRPATPYNGVSMPVQVATTLQRRPAVSHREVAGRADPQPAHPRRRHRSARAQGHGCTPLSRRARGRGGHQERSPRRGLADRVRLRQHAAGPHRGDPRRARRRRPQSPATSRPSANAATG